MRLAFKLLLFSLYGLVLVLALPRTSISVVEQQAWLQRRTLNPVDPDANRNFTEIIQSKGYPVETHNVTTEDGYILTCFRIPGNGPPVHLQHGLLDSSFTWILNEPNESLPYILHDLGYDVWMGNNRGNLYAKNHVSLDPDSKEFWQFSWDQMAQYDLPAMWAYIQQNTAYKKLVYVGHSEGTTIAFALLSTQPQLAASLYGFVGLGPVITAGYITNKFLKTLADLDVVEIFVLFGDKQFFPTPTLLHNTFVDACADCEICCDDVIEFICGPHKGAFNDSRMPVMAGHEPGGTSVQNVQHWSQMVKSGKFQKFDYGLFGNRQNYGQDHPPVYNILKFPQTGLPVALYSGSHDELADPTDVANLVAQLPNATFHLELPDYAHLDYVWALDARDQIYEQMFTFFQQWIGNDSPRKI